MNAMPNRKASNLKMNFVTPQLIDNLLSWNVATPTQYREEPILESQCQLQCHYFTFIAGKFLLVIWHNYLRNACNNNLASLSHKYLFVMRSNNHNALLTISIVLRICIILLITLWWAWNSIVYQNGKRLLQRYAYALTC